MLGRKELSTAPHVMISSSLAGRVLQGPDHDNLDDDRPVVKRSQPHSHDGPHAKELRPSQEVVAEEEGASDH